MPQTNYSYTKYNGKDKCIRCPKNWDYTVVKGKNKCVK